MIVCPRCATSNPVTEKFCIYCKWEFMSGWTLCEVCNQTLKDGKNCDLCSPDDAWISNNLDDWYQDREE